MTAAPVVILLGPHLDNGATQLCGLSLLDRMLLALEYGGAGAVTVVAAAPELAHPIIAARARSLECRVATAAPAGDGPLVLLAGDSVVNPAAVRAALAEAQKPGATLLLGGPGGALAVLREGAAAARDALPGGFAAALAAAGPVEERPAPPLAVALRYGKVGRIAANHALLEALRKGGDSWYTRYVSRSFSLPLSRALSWTRVTPNQLTGCALVFGLLCALIVVRATSHWELVLGYLCGELGEVCDAADGELARLTYKFSPYGTWLDTLTDDVASLAIHLATAYACLRLYGNHVMAGVGLVGAACFAFYVLVLYYNLVVHVGSGDAQALRWWVTPDSTAHTAGEELLAGRHDFQFADLTRTLSNREILILAYLVTAAMHILPVGIGFFAVIAVGLAFVAAGQVVVGYPKARP